MRALSPFGLGYGVNFLTRQDPIRLKLKRKCFFENVTCVLL